jgi:hypothetical protein
MHGLVRKICLKNIKYYFTYNVVSIFASKFRQKPCC